MTTGAPIYLVTACASAEEFVAAFRRYADRTGVFVPIAEPLPAGRTARFALTLTDGGVMIDGEAQIVQAWPKPGGLHGRAGMMLKFLVLDDASKTVLADLEKARLAMKPPPPSVAARPASVPAEPRATPPPIGGRVDAANARAQTVAIGDLATLRDRNAPAATNDDASGSGGMKPAKFAIPSIPNVGRPRTPSTPPRPAKQTTPPPSALAQETGTAIGPPPAPATVATTMQGAPTSETTDEDSSAKGRKLTSIGFAAFQAVHAKTEVPPDPPSARSTTLGVAPLRVQTQPLPVSPTPTTGELSADERPTATQPTAPMALPKASPPTRRSIPPTTPPPGPRRATPVTPLPIVRPPAPAATSPATGLDSELTDLTSPPTPPTATGDNELTDLSAASLSAAVVAEGEPIPVDAKTAASGELDPDPPAASRPKRAGGMRASEILAAIPNDDWTMTPDQSAPTVLPPSVAPPVVGSPAMGPLAVGPPVSDVPPQTARAPSGDWTMSADPAAPGGWSAPATVEPTPARSGNPVTSVASADAIQVQDLHDKPTSIGEPLVQVDSTLLEPLGELPAEEERPEPFHMPPPMPFAAPPGFAPPYAPQSGAPAYAAMRPPIGAGAMPMPGLPGTPVHSQPLPFAPSPYAGLSRMPLRDVTDAGTGFFRDSEALASLPYDPAHDELRRRKRVLLVAVCAAVAVITAVAVVLVVGNHKSTAANVTSDPAGPPVPVAVASSGSSAAAGPAGSAGSASAGGATAGGSGSSHPMTAEPASGSSAPSTAPVVASASATCSVDLTTTPAGAQISREDNTALGTTPGTFDVACGTETKLVVRKQSFFTAVKLVTATAEHTPISVSLARALFSMRVTSSPSGATITVGGKTAGITPTTIRFPAYQATSITIAKDGYTSDTQKLTIKQNNASHAVTLRRHR